MGDASTVNTLYSLPSAPRRISCFPLPSNFAKGSLEEWEECSEPSESFQDWIHGPICAFERTHQGNFHWKEEYDNGVELGIR
ncbi:uncharacterized protein G2W53_006127 [Senna tora]|uniref:Uncharacterized protein n=1 Tax=Senna tora TaxID=362788 RepID=A0A835CEH6_9FABA|nr:uncharacterized protein G2W53_006127 [Senna tora]